MLDTVTVSPATAPVPCPDPPPDLWVWRAIYDDDTWLDEYADGSGHGFREIDLDRMTCFLLLPTRDDLTTYQVKVDPASGQRAIFFRRRTIAVNPVDGQQVGDRRTVHCIGWQRTIANGKPDGVNVASYLFIFDDGSTLSTDDFRAV